MVTTMEGADAVNARRLRQTPIFLDPSHRLELFTADIEDVRLARIDVQHPNQERKRRF
jgi:hypothetical protein